MENNHNIIISGFLSTLVSTKRSRSSTSNLRTDFLMFLIVLSCRYLVMILLLGRIRATLVTEESWF
jgi:hypothetical protein